MNDREATKALHRVELEDYLRKDEGDSLTLVCDNPDFGGPNNRIICCGDWTKWEDRTFDGESLIDALEKAVAAAKGGAK